MTGRNIAVKKKSGAPKIPVVSENTPLPAYPAMCFKILLIPQKPQDDIDLANLKPEIVGVSKTHIIVNLGIGDVVREEDSKVRLIETDLCIEAPKQNAEETAEQAIGALKEAFGAPVDDVLKLVYRHLNKPEVKESLVKLIGENVGGDKTDKQPEQSNSHYDGDPDPLFR